MIIIVDIDEQKFSLNGIPYYKNFMPHAIGDKLRIVNTYDTKFELVPFFNFDEFSVNGSTFGNIIDLQDAILPVIYTRSTLGGGGGGGYTPDATESTKGKAQLATEAEALAGTNDTKIITPSKLQAVRDLLENLIGDKQDALLYTPANKAGETFSGAITATNLSGTNTGDETTSSILTKIGDGSFINQAYLPSYVDDVLEYANAAAFPVTGETGKIYIDKATNRQWRWSGSSYIQITNGLIGSTSDVPEGTNLYFTTARVLATVLTGISFATGGAIVSTDTVLIAFGKIQKQINDLSTVYQAILTDVNFGSFINARTPKNTLLDADEVVSNDSADSNKAKKTSWLNVWTNYLKPKADVLYQSILNYTPTKNIVSDYTNSSGVTGTASETLISSYKINANTLSSLDFMNMTLRLLKTGTTAGYLITIRIGTTSTFSTSLTQIAQFGNTLSTGADVNFQRHFKIEGGSLKGSTFTSNILANQGVSVNSAESSTSFNVSVDNWIFISVKPQSSNSDVITQSIFKITN